MKTYEQFKTGSARSDWFATQGLAAAGSLPTGAAGGGVNQIGQAAAFGSGIGQVMGLASGPATEAEELEWDKTPEKALIPGIAGNRVERRVKRQLLNDEGDNPHYWSQKFAPTIGGLGFALAGAGYGAYKGLPKSFYAGFGETDEMGNSIINVHRRAAGAALGAAGGIATFGLIALGASLLAAMKRTRTKEEQKEYANSSTAAEWLVPGLATYNGWKTLGRSFKDSDERIAKMQEEEAKRKKA